ncbi:PP2C family protein-serine/threonine phosphatase [Sulfitobacter sp.]|jgi:sigma-B regulation protein RsbU (phosphoserine phosphatase)|uniref:PP2C family protein-serine/threonine phosphatase n=1 Tax=Sulfitobacter sp. TaxID=1903071 RepID=UPI003EF9A812
MKIIVAEDNLVQRVYLSQLIDTLGYEAIPVEDGLEALDLVRDTQVQIVISDYQMPNLDGIQLTREIRKLCLDHYVYVIMITGSEQDDVRNEALEAGVDDFLNKMRSPVMLKARIRAATRMINHAEELAERNRIVKESNEHIQKDLQAAAEAQRQLLPDIREEMQGFTITSAFVPSSFVSGDMFGCFPLDENTLGFYAVDVSGHGVHASLLSVAIGYLITPEFFRTTVMKDRHSFDPAALVTTLNDRFSTADNDEYFTMFCGVIDTSTGRLEYCQAAYPPPYYVDQSGTAQTVGDGGFPVGMLPDLAYENNSMTIAPGGSLVVYSDAATEAENIGNMPFGQNRLRDIVTSIAEVGAQNMPDIIVKALMQWRGGNTLEDDLTVVALERKNSNDTHNAA